MAKLRPFQDVPARTPWWPLAVIVVAGLAAYANSFQGRFVFDDIHNVAENPFLRQLWPPWVPMFRSPGLPTRPLPYLTFALNYAVGGVNPGGYHAVNLAIHLAAGAALYEILRRTLLSWNERHGERYPAVGLALAAALLWVVHPLQTQAVTYVYQRIESLMGLALLLTLLTFIVAMQSNRPRLWLALSVLACAAGMASKEVMIVAPLIVLWYDRVFVAAGWRDLTSQRWGYYAGLAATWGVLLAIVWSQRGQYSELDEPVHSRTAYFFTQPAVVLWYLRLLVWPVGQCLDYGWQPYETWDQVVGPLAVMLVLLAATGWLLWKHPALGFVAGSFFLILSVTSSVLVVADLANEHRMYLASAAAIVLLVLGAYSLLSWARSRNPAFLAPDGPLLIGVLAVVILALIALTHARNRIYQDDVKLWESVVAQAPLNARAVRNVLFAYNQRRDPAGGVALCRQILARHPDSHAALCRLGEAQFIAGQYDQALATYRQALAREPEDDEVLYDLGLVYAQQGDQPRATDYFRRALEIFPGFQKAHHALGKSLAALGQDQAAAESFRRAIAIGRYNTDAMQDLAVILDAQGHTAEAVALFREYLEVHPDHLAARDNLGLALAGGGDFHAAAAEFAEVLRANPAQVQTRISLVQALARAGEPQAALAVIEEGLEVARQLNRPQDHEQLMAAGRKLAEQKAH